MNNLPQKDDLPAEFSDMVDRLVDSLKDLNHSECTSRTNIIRWLRSRNWNELETERMLRTHIQWRRERQVDTILSWYRVPDAINNYFPGGICGSDKHGRPLFVAPVGHFDPKSFMKAVSRTEFLQSRIYQMEYILKVVLPEASAKFERDIDQLTVIMDMQGLGFKHMSPSWLSIMMESVTMVEANYPEVLGICFVINAPPLFTRLYNVFKPLLSKATQEKIQVLDSNYEASLLLHFDAESLPAIYGGSLRDPNGDPRCPSRICWAGPVPESVCSQKAVCIEERTPKEQLISRSCSVQSLGTNDQFTVVEVNRGALRDVPIGFLSSGVELQWCIICESHDIGVGWFVEPSMPSEIRCSSQASMGLPSTSVALSQQRTHKNTTPLEVLPIQRITGPLNPFTGQCQIKVPGSYYMRLDNSYSWMRAKRIRYALKVTIPKDSPVIPMARNIPSRHSAEVGHQTNANYPCPKFTPSSSEDNLVVPLPPENPAHSLLVTGGSMDVNISLLFRLFAQLVLVPKCATGTCAD